MREEIPGGCSEPEGPVPSVMSGESMPDAPPPTHRPGQPTLLDQVREAIRTRHDSMRTEHAYIQWIKRFILFHDTRHPAEMGEDAIRAFVNHVAVTEHVAASTHNQALCGLLFLYKDVLKRDLDAIGDLVWAKKPERLPVVLTRTEVTQRLSQLFRDHMDHRHAGVRLGAAPPGVPAPAGQGSRL